MKKQAKQTSDWPNSEETVDWQRANFATDDQAASASPALDPVGAFFSLEHHRPTQRVCLDHFDIAVLPSSPAHLREDM